MSARHAPCRRHLDSEIRNERLSPDTPALQSPPGLQPKDRLRHSSGLRHSARRGAAMATRALAATPVSATGSSAAISSATAMGTAPLHRPAMATLCRRRTPEIKRHRNRRLHPRHDKHFRRMDSLSGMAGVDSGGSVLVHRPVQPATRPGHSGSDHIPGTDTDARDNPCGHRCIHLGYVPDVATYRGNQAAPL